MNAKPRPLFVVLSGPSGAGKDAVLDELERRGHAFHRVVTCTTRPARVGERHGEDYYFVTQMEFDALLRNGGLLEHATVYGDSYGVPKQQVLDMLGRGVDVYVRTDVQGAAAIKGVMSDAVRVFVAPASLEELEQRLRDRNSDDEARIERRLATARSEMARAGEFEHVVVNESGRLEAAVDKIEAILADERSGVSPPVAEPRPTKAKRRKRA
jgi:guanylate kinase